MNQLKEREMEQIPMTLKKNIQDLSGGEAKPHFYPIEKQGRKGFYEMDLGETYRHLSGKERAQLVIKDSHYTQVLKKGFLTEEQKGALLSFPTKRIGEDYRRVRAMYLKTPYIGSSLMEAFLKFRIALEDLERYLRAAHFTYNLAEIRRSLEKAKEEAHKLEGISEAIKFVNILLHEDKKMDIGEGEDLRDIDPEGKWIRTPDRGLELAQDAALRTRATINSFWTVSKILQLVEKELHFNPFEGMDIDKQRQTWREQVLKSIEKNDKAIREDLTHIIPVSQAYKYQLFEPQIDPALLQKLAGNLDLKLKPADYQ